MLHKHPRELMCLKQNSGIGRGHGRSAAAKTIRDQKQQIQELKAKIKELQEGNAGTNVKPSKNEVKPPKTNLQPGPALDNIFHDKLNEIRKRKDVPQIFELRRELNLPREVFDEEIRRLRDSMSINMAQAEARYYTPDELADCWVDENGYVMGTIRWAN